MSISQFDQIAAEIGRELVARVAPQELPLYRSLSTAYLQAPSAISSTSTNQDEMLGFGVAEAVTYLTPFVLPVLAGTLKFLADELKSTIHDDHLVGDVLKRLFSRAKPAPTPELPNVTLTPKQLEQVRKLAFEKACELNLKTKQASMLADSIVGSLAVPA